MNETKSTINIIKFLKSKKGRRIQKKLLYFIGIITVCYIFLVGDYIYFNIYCNKDKLEYVQEEQEKINNDTIISPEYRRIKEQELQELYEDVIEKNNKMLNSHNTIVFVISNSSKFVKILYFFISLILQIIFAIFLFENIQRFIRKKHNKEI